ncbi:methyltransferase domain-containing protein [Antribacter sp. KLBMP9083]|uniref:Methyltransferase domain-containing protein n=1 Tax=Antribacter soli TaxID=2910976 RepID=A0AA41QGP4_9MICO|nr:class I SAM-dependent methyltransferase [Antribacter soli]MCF4121764.1 methyltransferase domain-containing protein [Antribacter soli]
MPDTAPDLDPYSLADRAASFEHGADVYAAVRPSYPGDAVSWLLPQGSPRVLDLAAGTGKLTALLADRRLDVVAVEPSESMLGHLRATLPGVTAMVGTAEEIPLPDGSVDAVLVAQAWHWFRQPAASAEIARVLRPGGHLGIVWNTRDDAVDWVARFGEILHRGDSLEPTSAAARVGPLGDAFGPLGTATFRWVDRITTASLRPLAASRSYLISLPEAARDALLAEVDELVATHPDLADQDVVGLPYVTECYRAVRA